MADTHPVDQLHPSWYPKVLKELHDRYPHVYMQIVGTVVYENAVKQCAKYVEESR